MDWWMYPFVYFAIGVISAIIERLFAGTDNDSSLTLTIAFWPIPALFLPGIIISKIPTLEHMKQASEIRRQRLLADSNKTLEQLIDEATQS
jgi:hypothetical protein